MTTTPAHPLIRPLRQVVLALLAISLAAFLPGAAAAMGHRHGTHAHTVELGVVGSGALDHHLTPETALFWSSPEQTCYADECEAWSWTVEVKATRPGQSLQVAVDEAYMFDENLLEVIAPDGGTLTAKTGQYGYSTAVTVPDAPRGVYEVRVQPHAMRQSEVRLRAGLVDAGGAEDRPVRDLLPNLRAQPPHDFTFAMPVIVVPGFDIGVYDTASPVPGSCHPDEQQVYLDPTQTDDPRLVTDCLRFTTGPENPGEGHLDLRYRWPADPTSARTFPMNQVIHRSDGTMTERPAGTAEFHPTHAHNHHAETMIYALLEVDGDEVSLASGGVKTGFCPLDLGLADWRNFSHSVQHELRLKIQPGNCIAPWFSTNAEYYTDPSNLQGAMGISAGWSDFYHRGFAGQFVDFTGQDDGVYVVRATVDHEDLILESDETDNTAYALIRVTGEDVEILERGYGTDHLDPAKVVVDDDNRDSRAPLPFEEGTRRFIQDA